jgi:3-methyladenine DNA glycosylase AlkD
VRRSITTMVLDELAHLKASHARGDLMALAIRRVVEDQYEDLGAEARETIIEGWTQSIRNWNRIDWLATIGRDAPEIR